MHTTTRNHASWPHRLWLAVITLVGLLTIVGSGGGTGNVFDDCQLPSPRPGSCDLSIQPPRDATVVEGQDATFEVVVGSVSFNPVSVQWQACPPGTDPASCGWTPLPGETAFTLTIHQAALSQDGTLYRAAIDAPYSSPATSDPAKLTVTRPTAPVLSAQPASLTVTEGQVATFSVTASGSALQFQWERSDDGSPQSFVPIPGAIAASYSKANVQIGASPAGDNNAHFRVIVSNSGGSATSDTATLTVTPALQAPTISQPPQSLSVTPGAMASFSVVAAGTPPLTYQWRKNRVAVGSNSSTLSLTAALSDDGALIDVIVSNPAGSVTSAAATLGVTPGIVAPAITAQPQDTAVGIGATASFSVAATGSSLVYQWQRSDDGGATFGIAPGVSNGATYQVGSVQLADNGARLRVVVSNTAGAATSNAATLTVTAFVARQLAAGNGCSFALKASGAALSWGSDQLECLGNGAGINGRNAPGSVSAMADAVKVSAPAYGYHALVVRANGEAWAWGYDNVGQLANGNNTNQPEPVAMTTAETGNPAIANATAVAAGTNHSLLLRGDGTVWAAGFNLNGQLGDGSTANRNRAVAVSGLGGATAIAAGDRFSMALRNDGTVWTWGSNAQGQLGSGATVSNSRTPVQVSGLTNVVAIAAGFDFALALNANGDVWAWGNNDQGQLGDGSGVASRNVPSKVSISGVASIAAGWKHAVAALSAGGTLRAWGDNRSGQLGAGDLVNRPTPTAVAGLQGVNGLAAGFVHTMVIDGAGNVWAWGSNGVGELGLGSTAQRFTTPQQLPGP